MHEKRLEEKVVQISAVSLTLYMACGIKVNKELKFRH